MNFPFGDQLTALFDRYSDDYEYTPKEYFVWLFRHNAPECGTLMAIMARTTTQNDGLEQSKLESTLAQNVTKMKASHRIFGRMKMKSSRNKIYPDCSL